MKVLFLFPYPLGVAPSQRFRFEQYLDQLKAHGIECSHQSFWNVKSWAILYNKGYYVRKIVGFMTGFARRFWMLTRVSQMDFIFIHRECFPVGPPIIEWIIAFVFNKKIIFDFDDAIWLPNTSQENKLASIIKWHNKTKAICAWSFKVSCGNSYLASFAKKYNDQVVLNPTTIDTINLHNPSLYNITKDKNIITIGWTGTHSTLKYLYKLTTVIERLEKKYTKLKFIVIANKNPSFHLHSFCFKPWSKENEIQDLLQFDIGIMPLENDIWAKGKCGFKALQYMALGIPTIASPVGVNTEIINNGVNGFLCDEQTTWFDCICNLIDDRPLYEQLAVNARRTVVESYSVSSNSLSFLSLFSMSINPIAKNGSNGIL